MPLQHEQNSLWHTLIWWVPWPVLCCDCWDILINVIYLNIFLSTWKQKLFYQLLRDIFTSPTTPSVFPLLSRTENMETLFFFRFRKSVFRSMLLEIRKHSANTLIVNSKFKTVKYTGAPKLWVSIVCSTGHFEDLSLIIP